MGPSPNPRNEHPINLNYLPQLGSQPPRSGSSTGNTSPTELSSGGSGRFAMSTGTVQGGLNSTASGMRLGAGSPSHEYGGRLFAKRAREIQAQEGLGPQIWGPPTSGHSTPLRETIPESPNGDSFPDFTASTSSDPQPARRARAGTLPSRFSPSGNLPGLSAHPSLISKTSRPTPSTSPFKPGPATPTENATFQQNAAMSAAASKQASALLARLRSGSMPQRPSLMSNNSSPFGSALGIGMNYPSARERSSTLHSIQSSNTPNSPQSSFSKDSLFDNDVKTLDYLGLAETPQQLRPTLQPSDIEMLLEQQRATNPQFASLQNSRFRSYSVNAKEKYAEEDDYDSMAYAGGYSGTLTPTAEAMALNEAVRQHNLEVQAFANFASASRPRARTAGILDSPSTRMMRNYFPGSSRLDSSLNASDLSEEAEYHGLAEAVHQMHLHGKPTDISGDESTLEGPTRALWLGNIPSSTTVSSLNVIFQNYGPIESTRVLTHKNCGFVNFESQESAIHAKSQLNGKEIFPGAGPVRIGYAKVPSASVTPGNNGVFPSTTPDPQAKPEAAHISAPAPDTETHRVEPVAAPLSTPKLPDIRGEIVDIVKDLGASDEEQARIAAFVDEAIKNDNYEKEVPPIPEPSHNRIHDAPRLREIRKRIDNQSCSQPEIEDIAMQMLPEIAELSSDYLGNTVVQKLFEFCSESVKDAMLREIAPHLAEIGIHKNGTWAAQKIIDVARSPTLMKLVTDSLRPYSVALFLDQFGNYVMQGCLRYAPDHNTFIFDAMLSRLWELAQGRFGARAMRACLESHYATKDQQRMIAATIALHSVQLATNANGALLLTWFLDTCTFPRRRTVLAPRLVPHLVHLCTHKVAYLTVLKIINQRNEPEARDTILKALFFSPNDQVLEDILGDQACGATLIFKVLTTPFFDEKLRPDVVQNVRNVLLRIKAQPAQGYKRLMDEVNLSTRGTRDHSAVRGAASEGSRPGSKQGDHIPPPGLNEVNRQYFSQGMAQVPFDANIGLQRTGSMDSNGFEQFAMNNNPMFAGNGLNMASQQMQYQQAMLAASRGQNFFPQMNGFGTAAPAVDGFRAGAGLGNQGMMSQSGFGQAGFNPMMNPQLYPYQNPYLPQQPQQPIAAGRRGRR